MEEENAEIKRELPPLDESVGDSQTIRHESPVADETVPHLSEETVKHDVEENKAETLLVSPFPDTPPTTPEGIAKAMTAHVTGEESPNAENLDTGRLADLSRRAHELDELRKRSTTQGE